MTQWQNNAKWDKWDRTHTVNVSSWKWGDSLLWPWSENWKKKNKKEMDLCGLCSLGCVAMAKRDTGVMATTRPSVIRRVWGLNSYLSITHSWTEAVTDTLLFLKVTLQTTIRYKEMDMNYFFAIIFKKAFFVFCRLKKKKKNCVWLFLLNRSPLFFFYVHLLGLWWTDNVSSLFLCFHRTTMKSFGVPKWQ